MAYVSSAWAKDALPTEAGLRSRTAGSSRNPSSSPAFYRSVRAVCAVNQRVLRPSAAQQSFPASARRPPTTSKHDSPVRRRPTTAAATSSSYSVNPTARVDTFRVQGRLSIEGGLLEGGDVRAPHITVHGDYAQPSSELKKLRHDVAAASKPRDEPFRKLTQALRPSADHFLLELDGSPATLPSQFWKNS